VGLFEKAKEWITANGIATNEELDTLSEEVKELVKQEKMQRGKNIYCLFKHKYNMQLHWLEV
jgi:uncharacterized damage-inducible protein DinB